MRINSISTKNYRTLQNLTIPFSRGYCTISGRNNSGKSSLIRLLSKLFKPDSSSFPWELLESGFDYKQEKTQWVQDPLPITISYTLELTKTDDPALISFIEKMAEMTLPSETVRLVINLFDKRHRRSERLYLG
jgi:putative ATP-dependent endonuclease of the OLD family